MQFQWSGIGCSPLLGFDSECLCVSAHHTAAPQKNLLVDCRSLAILVGTGSHSSDPLVTCFVGPLLAGVGDGPFTTPTTARPPS